MSSTLVKGSDPSPKCYNCYKTGHVARDCLKPWRTPTIKDIEEEEEVAEFKEEYTSDAGSQGKADA